MNSWFLQFLIGGAIEAMRHPQDWEQYIALSRFLRVASARTRELIVTFETKH